MCGRTRPSSETVLNHLAHLRSINSAPFHPKLLYPAFVDALRSEGENPAQLADELILHDGARWVAPNDALLGKHLRDESGLIHQLESTHHVRAND